ncbi:hypothetical protein, partial [Pseudomonas fragi]|uniref:hypothetical protein n=1 Tax=Pseudomonas fragi TaxID=296 RepID=UPI0020030A67
MGDGCDLLDLVCLTETLSTYPAFVSNWNIGFALTASPFLKDLYGPDTWLTGVRGHGGHFSASQLRRKVIMPWDTRDAMSLKEEFV